MVIQPAGKSKYQAVMDDQRLAPGQLLRDGREKAEAIANDTLVK